MKNVVLRLITMVVLGVLLLGLLPGKTQYRETEAIAVYSNPEPDEIYVYIRSARARHQDDGNRLVEVEFTTDTAQVLTEMRMVTVYCGKQNLTFALTEENQGDVHRVSFLTAEQPETVRIEIRAHETQEGLLLISDGEGQLCGRAETPVDGDRILLLSGACPGTTYQIYRIAELPELLSGELCLSENPTVKERETYAIPDRYAITLVADSEGTATCNFTREGFADGLYLAVGEEEDFYLCIPRVDTSGELIGSILRISLGQKVQICKTSQIAQKHEKIIEYF